MFPTLSILFNKVNFFVKPKLIQFIVEVRIIGCTRTKTIPECFCDNVILVLLNCFLRKLFYL